MYQPPVPGRGFAQMGRLCPVPPSPEVMSTLYMEYLRVGKPQNLTFFQYLAVIGYANPAHNKQGMDDASHLSMSGDAPELIAIPDHPLTGPLRVKVLLIDFSDRPGTLPIAHYDDLLFSRGQHPTGSMFDYYREVSLDKVEISGSVHGLSLIHIFA